jgi:hypothetical protein
MQCVGGAKFLLFLLPGNRLKTKAFSYSFKIRQVPAFQLPTGNSHQGIRMSGPAAKLNQARLDRIAVSGFIASFTPLLRTSRKPPRLLRALCTFSVTASFKNPKTSNK